MKESTWMYIFIGVFVTLAFLNVVVFSIKRDVNFRKKYEPIAGSILIAVFFLMPVVQFWPSPLVLIFPLVAGTVIFLGLKLTKFCDRCGKFRYNRQPFEKMNYCSVCGEKFESAN